MKAKVIYYSILAGIVSMIFGLTFIFTGLVQQDQDKIVGIYRHIAARKPVRVYITIVIRADEALIILKPGSTPEERQKSYLWSLESDGYVIFENRREVGMMELVTPDSLFIDTGDFQFRGKRSP